MTGIKIYKDEKEIEPDNGNKKEYVVKNIIAKNILSESLNKEIESLLNYMLKNGYELQSSTTLSSVDINKSIYNGSFNNILFFFKLIK